MASSILSYKPLHGVAESSDLLATVGGSHLINGVADVDLDNGSFVGIGEFNEGDSWKVTKPSSTGELYLVLTSPLIYEDFTKEAIEERHFFNKAGEMLRLYQLKVRDKFALSTEAFADGSEIVIGSYLTFDDYKAGVTTTKPESGHVLKVYDRASLSLIHI